MAEWVEGAGIQMPSFTSEVIFAQIPKLALDINSQISLYGAILRTNFSVPWGANDSLLWCRSLSGYRLKKIPARRFPRPSRRMQGGTTARSSTFTCQSGGRHTRRGGRRWSPVNEAGRCTGPEQSLGQSSRRRPLPAWSRSRCRRATAPTL